MSCSCSSDPIACNLSAFSADERRAHEALLGRVMKSRTATIERENGFHFTFHDAAIASDIAKWMVLEQRCCPFFEFDLTLGAKGALSLSIRGPSEAKEILRAAFG